MSVAPYLLTRYNGAMRHWRPQIIKKNGAVQRSDVALTKEVVNALTRSVRESGSVITRADQARGYVTVPTGENTLQIRVGTLQSWIARETVIPETGQILREVLDAAREEYRVNRRRQIDEAREEIIDKKFNRAISMRTKEPVVGMFGVVKDPTTGEPMYRENVKLLAEQMKNVRFLAERQFPERYGKVERGEHKHLVLSLSDLRKYEEARKKAEEAQGH